jgi:hypothetical protein
LSKEFENTAIRVVTLRTSKFPDTDESNEHAHQRDRDGIRGAMVRGDGVQRISTERARVGSVEVEKSEEMTMTWPTHQTSKFPDTDESNEHAHQRDRDGICSAMVRGDGVQRISTGRARVGSVEVKKCDGSAAAAVHHSKFTNRHRRVERS